MLSHNSVQKMFKRINQRFYHFSRLVSGNASAGKRLALIDFLTRGLSGPTSHPSIQGNLTCIMLLKESCVLNSPGDRWQFVSTLGYFFFYVFWGCGDHISASRASESVLELLIWRQREIAVSNVRALRGAEVR